MQLELLKQCKWKTDDALAAGRRAAELAVLEGTCAWDGPVVAVTELKSDMEQTATKT